MHIDVVPNRGSRPAVLLRESYREGKKVRKRTLANLSALPMAKVELIRCVLRGDALAPVESVFDITQSGLHGHVDGVLTAMRRLGMASTLSARPCRERNLVMALVASRILDAGLPLDQDRRPQGAPHPSPWMDAPNRLPRGASSQDRGPRTTEDIGP